MEEQKPKVNEQPYVPFYERAEKIKDEVAKKRLSKKEPKVQITNEQYELAKATIHLRHDEGFKKFMNWINEHVAYALKTAFQPKAPGSVVPKEMIATQKDWGQMMSFNEGYYLASLKPKEIERLWLAYLESEEVNKDGKN
jgi:hypothetical protein